MNQKPSETAIKVILAIGSAVSLSIAVHRWLSSVSYETLVRYQVYGLVGLYVIAGFLLVFLLDSELNKH